MRRVLITIALFLGLLAWGVAVAGAASWARRTTVTVRGRF
jgi:hypothetical protein